MFKNPSLALEKRSPRSDRCRHDAIAFTRIELVALLAAVTLLALIALPTLAADRIRTHRAVCANNLSRIGKALADWASDYGEKYPWEVPDRFGGTQGRINPTSFHFAVLSNELITPHVLVCPSDGTRTKARDFAWPSFDDDNISYFLSHPFATGGPSVLAGDRNLQGSTGRVGCPNFSLAESLPLPATNASWAQTIHARRGHLLFNDGRVEGTTDNELRDALSRTAAASAVFHFLPPNP